MTLKKARWKSKTILSAIALALILLWQITGVEIAQGEVGNILEHITAAALILVNIYGRFTADSKLS